MQFLCKLNWVLQNKRFRIPDGSLSLPQNYISVEVNSIFEDFNQFALFLHHKQTNWPSKRLTDSIVIIFPSVCCLFYDY